MSGVVMYSQIGICRLPFRVRLRPSRTLYPMSAQIPPRGPMLSAVLGLIAFSAVAAVLVTASVTPMIAVSSVTAQSAIGIFNNLPTYISIGKLPGPNTIYAESAGKEVPVATIFDENRQQVAWNKISTAAKNAAVDGEDRRFYIHGGVDLTGIIAPHCLDWARAAVASRAHPRSRSSWSRTSP